MTFRYELKLVAPASWLPQLRSILHFHEEAFREQHPPRQVNSLYFDTAQLGAYQANLLGDTRRHKLRLRWYGKSFPLVDGQLELKRKRNMMGDKKLFLLPQPIDLSAPWMQLRRVLLSATPTAWQMAINEATEAISVTQYWREYLVSADSQIRVTLDYKQRFFAQRGYFRPNLRYPSLHANNLVIELKCNPIFSDRLEALTGELPVRRARNSKYVNSITTLT